MKSLILFISIFVSTVSAATTYKTGILPFDLINPENTQNIIGDTQIIGNTVECVTSSFRVASSDYSNLDCSNDLDKNDNNYIVKYIDIDSDNTTFNSSTATLKFPSTYKEIAWAGLFWQGHINNYSYISSTTPDTYPYDPFAGWDYYYLLEAYDYDVGLNFNMSSDFTNNNINDTTANTLKLKVGTNTYQTVTAEQVNYIVRGSNIGNGYSGIIYSSYADVTDKFATYTAGTTLDITVANIMTTEGLQIDLGNYGAWTLVVIYKEDESNTASKLRNNAVYLGYEQVSSANNTDAKAIQILLKDFVLPKTGTIDSQMAVFAAEGEYAYSPDYMQLDSTPLGDPDLGNVFDARLSSSITRSPSLINNNGIDIDIFDTSTIMTAKRDADPTALTYSATIKLKSEGDLYLPSMVSFTTELYRPRVCYYIDTIRDTNGTTIFEDKGFVGEIISDEEYIFDLTIANMRASITDGIQDADLVQIYMKMTDFNYTSESTSIQNSQTTGYLPQDDIYTTNTSDLGDYNSTITTSNWRLGLNASNVDGGTLISTSSLSDANNAHVKFNGVFSLDTNTTNINLLDYLEFKASFRVDGLIITPENASLIVQCVDLNTSGAIGVAPAGAYNAVDEGTTVITTKISGKAFPIQILSYAADNVTPAGSSQDLSITVIETPAWTGDTTADIGLCNDPGLSPIAPAVPINLGGSSSGTVTIPAIASAYKSVSIRIAYDDSGTQAYACSSDAFAIRPDKFSFTTPLGENITTLASGQDFYFPITATQDGVLTAAPKYNISGLTTFPNLDADKVTFLSDGTPGVLNGDLVISPINFSFVDGSSTGMPVSFSDVGQVEINLIDRTWAAVDVLDTPQECSTNGAFICGKITPTYIPDHFTFVTPVITNNNGTSNAGDFTYIANAIPANVIPFTVAARINTQIEARNSNNGVTTNFDQAATMYENPISVNLVVNHPTHGLANVTTITAADGGASLGFNNGTYTLPWNSVDTTKMLRFNFTRQTNVAINPFQVLPADVTLTATSTYGATQVTQDPLSGIGGNIGQSATFVYGRTHATRQRFVGTTGIAFIYYENYCDGAGCDKSLLPNDVASVSTDDPRWFINTPYVAGSGNVGTINQKGGGGDVTAAAAVNGAPASVVLTYNGTAYPFKTTMENNASTWLRYDMYKADPVLVNEFQVEFTDSSNTWAGVHETNTTTGVNSSDKTNRRTMW